MMMTLIIGFAKKSRYKLNVTEFHTHNMIMDIHTFKSNLVGSDTGFDKRSLLYCCISRINIMLCKLMLIGRGGD